VFPSWRRLLLLLWLWFRCCGRRRRLFPPLHHGKFIFESFIPSEIKTAYIARKENHGFAALDDGVLSRVVVFLMGFKTFRPPCEYFYLPFFPRFGVDVHIASQGCSFLDISSHRNGNPNLTHPAHFHSRIINRCSRVKRACKDKGHQFYPRRGRTQNKNNKSKIKQLVDRCSFSLF